MRRNDHGHRDHGPKLLGLDERPSGERLPRDPRGKAEIVLDASGRAGLSSERARLEHEHAKGLGRGVDSSREARGPGSDHDDVEDMIAWPRG